MTTMSHHAAARTLLGISLVLAFLSGCDTDSAVAPVEPPPPSVAPSQAPPALMAMQHSNANSCTVHLNPSRATRTETRLALPERSRRAAPGKPLSRMQFLRWDGVSKQPSALIDCVIPKDSLAVEALKDYFLRDEGAAIGQRSRTSSALNSDASALANTFYDGMTCWYDPWLNDFDCDGIDCTANGSAMVAGVSQINSAAASGGQTSATQEPSGQYICENGCTLWADGMGGVGFNCPEDDGDGEGGGGGGGGNPGPAPDEPDVDPAGLCSDLIDSVVEGSMIECGVGPDPILVKAAVLRLCPPTAVGVVIHPQSLQTVSFSLTRAPSGIRSKSFGGVVRYDVAEYRGTISLGGVPSTMRGSVWCSVGVGIFEPVPT